MASLRKVFASAIKSGKKSKKNGESMSSAPSLPLDDSFDTIQETTSIVGNNTMEGMNEPRAFSSYSDSSTASKTSSKRLPSLDIPTVSESRSDLDDREYYPRPSSTSSRRSPSQDTTDMITFQMQMELVQLRERIKLLDDGNGESRSELLDLINERDEEVSQLNVTIQNLKGKLNEIHSNLGQFRDERHSLRESVSILEKEKKNLARHLYMREQEVVSLVKRLAGEEERLKEGIQLRTKNQSLINELQDIKSKFATDDNLQIDNQKLREEILHERNEKNAIQTELTHLKTKLHEDQIENKRRLDQIQIVSNLEKMRIKELTETLRERDDLIASLKSESELLKLEYEANLNNEKGSQGIKESEMYSEISKIKTELECVIETLKAELQKKCDMIALLNEQSYEQMKLESDLMVQRDSQSRATEHQTAHLKRQNEELQSQVGELSNRNEEIVNHQKQAQIESEISFATRLSAAQAAFQESENEITATHNNLLSALKREMDDRIEQMKINLILKDQTITSLEDRTLTRLSAAQAAFQERDNEITSTHNKLISTLKGEMDDRIEQMEMKLISKDQTITSLEDRTLNQTQKIMALQSQLESLSVDGRHEIMELTHRNENLTCAFSKFEQERDESIRNLSEELGLIQKERNYLLGQMKSLESALVVLEEEKQTILLSHSVEQESLQSTVDEMESAMNLKIDQSANTIACLKDELTELKEQLKTSEEQASARAAFQERESEITATHNKRISTLKGEMDDRIEQMEMKLISKDQTITSLEDRTLNQTHKIMALQSQLESLSVDGRHEIMELTHRNEKLTCAFSKFEQERDESIRNLSEELGLIQKERNYLLGQMKSLESALVFFEEEKQTILSSHSAEQKSLQSTVDEMESVMNLKTDQSANTIACLKNELAKLKEQLQTSEEQATLVKSEDAHTNKKILELKQQLDKFVASQTADVAMFEHQIQLQRNQKQKLEEEIISAGHKEEGISQQLEKSRKANLELREHVSLLNRKVSQLEEDPLLISQLEQGIANLQDSLSLLKNQKRDIEIQMEARIGQSRKETESLLKENEALKVSMAEAVRRSEQEKDIEIASLSDQLQSKETIILSLRDTIAAHEEIMKALRGDIAKQKINAKQDASATRFKLERMQSQFNVQKAELEAEKEAAIAKSRKETESLIREIKALEMSMAEAVCRVEQEKDFAVGLLSDQLQSKEAIISSLRDTVAAHEDTMKILKGDIAEQKTNAKQEASAARTKLEKMQALLNLQKEDLAIDKEEAVMQSRIKTETVLKEYDALRASTAETLSRAKQEQDDAFAFQKNQLESKEAIIITLREASAVHEEAMRSLRGDIAKQQIDAKQDASSARSRLERMQKARRALEDQVRAQENSISEFSRQQEHSNREKHLLETELLSLKKSNKGIELNSAEIVADLEDQIERLQYQLESLERSSSRESEDLRAMLTGLQKKFNETNSEKTTLREDFLSLQLDYESIKLTSEEKLAGQTSTISTLMKRRSSQEQSLAAFRVELDKERREYRYAAEQLEAEAKRWRAEAENISAARSREMEDMQEKCETLEMKMLAQRDELEHLRATLNERTNLLGDMVAQNKATNSDLFDTRALVSDLQEESELYLRAKREAEINIAYVEKTKKELEERLVRSLQQERSSRQNLETELLRLKDFLENKKSEGRSAAELEREISILKDKVVRQEQYLKRKLKQEKILKERLAAFGGAKLSLDVSQSWDMVED